MTNKINTNDKGLTKTNGIETRGVNIQSLQEEISKYGLKLEMMERDIKILKERAGIGDDDCEHTEDDIKDFYK